MIETQAPNKIEGEDLDLLEWTLKSDFFYFVRNVLAKMFPDKFGLINARHFRACYDLIYNKFNVFSLYQFGYMRPAPQNDIHNKKLIIVPRSHGKTRVFVEAFVMWLLYKNPNLRILIQSNTAPNAMKVLDVIKSYYVSIAEHPLFSYLIGDVRGSKWNEEFIIIKQRTSHDKTPSIDTGGLETEKTSQHYDIVISDDLVCKANVTNLEQIEKTKAAIVGQMELGDYNKDFETLYIYTGTMWAHNCWYADVLEEDTEQLRKWGLFFDVIKLRCWNVKTHEPLFPEKFSTEILEHIRNQKLASDSPGDWYNQWLNEPTDNEQAVFPPDYIQYYDPDRIPRDAEIVISCDIALSKEKWADYTAIVPIAIDRFDRRFVLPYLRFRENDPTRIAFSIIDMAKQYRDKNLTFVGIEEGVLFNALLPHLNKWAEWLPLVPLKIRNRSKFERIMGLQIFLKLKRLYLQKGGMIELKDQLIKFNNISVNSMEIDLLDALAYHIDLCPQATKAEIKTEEDYKSMPISEYVKVYSEVLDGGEENEDTQDLF